LKRVLKWIGIILGALLLLAVAVVVVTNIITRQKMARVYDVEVEAVEVPEGDAAAIARGEHIVTVLSDCTGCHGEDLAGYRFFEGGPVGSLVSRNITPAAGLAPEDYVRAIRHGLDEDGTPLAIMPAQNLRHMSDADLGAVIAYLQTVPAVENDPGEHNLTPLGGFLVGSGQLPLFPAEVIDHDSPPPPAPAEGPTVEYGEYLVHLAGCRDCHGANLAGGLAGPGLPPGPNLTPGGELAQWDEADFFGVIREGKHPSGRDIDPFMPWMTFRNMTDAEVQALWAYLQTLPAREYEGPQ
jgi:mono/diheme cytochrome c family protein